MATLYRQAPTRRPSAARRRHSVSELRKHPKHRLNGYGLVLVDPWPRLLPGMSPPAPLAMGPSRISAQWGTWGAVQYAYVRFAQSCTRYTHATSRQLLATLYLTSPKRASVGRAPSGELCQEDPAARSTGQVLIPRLSVGCWCCTHPLEAWGACLGRARGPWRYNEGSRAAASVKSICECECACEVPTLCLP